MDADAGHLQKFTDVPYVIEAPASRSRAASAAAKALSGLRVEFDGGRPLPKGRYGAIVEAVRAQINDDLRPPSNWRIDIFDRTAKDLTKEGLRIDRTLSGFKREVANDKEGAFATPFPVTAGPGQVKGCVIVGFPETVTPAEVLSGIIGGPVPTHGLTAERFHRNSLWHELGHCLLGASEAKADTFAALMSLRHGNLDKAALATLASWRELNEWTSPRPGDNHFIAAPLWEVVARADALVADKRFMTMGIEGIAGLAKSMTERFGLDADGIREAMMMRQAFQDAARLPHHLVPGPDGKPRKGDLRAWGAAHVDIPEIARMDEVALNLVSGAKPLKRFDYDFKALRARLDGLARGGDPTAKAMVASLERSARRKDTDDGHDFVTEIPYRFDTDAFTRGVLALAPGASLALAGRKQEEAAVETVAAPGPR